jgi:hypothetical protein
MIYPILDVDIAQISNFLLQTALFASWFTYGLSGIFWLFMNKGLWFSSPRKIALTALNVFVIAVGAAIVCHIFTLICYCFITNMHIVWSRPLRLRQSNPRQPQQRKLLLC